MALVGGSISYFDKHVGCNTQYKGLLAAYDSIDSYIIQADTDLCSADCPCYMNSTTHQKFISNMDSAPYYNMWEKTANQDTGAIQFKNCSDIVRNRTLQNYITVNAYSNYTLDANMFADYYRNVETWFNCSGFCETTYYNDRLKTNMNMFKYVFSDIGRGVPQHEGCLKPILEWLPLALNAFGSMGLFIACFEGFVLYCAIAWLCSNGEASESKKNQEHLASEKDVIKESGNKQSDIKETDVNNKKEEKHDTNEHKTGVKIELGLARQ